MWKLGTAGFLLAAAACGLHGQAFEAVSIKRSTDWGDRLRRGMGVNKNASLLLLIQFAYTDHSAAHWLPLPASEVVGGPAWMNSEGYDIQTTPASGDPKQIWPMWQRLLADRFGLKLHRETRELPIYNLTAVNGFKRPAAKAVECVSFPPGTPPRQVPGKVDCGYVSGPFGGGAPGESRIRGSRVRVADLARELASILDRPVVDKTGFAGEFDLDLRYTDIFAALEEQLGFRLVAAKGPVGVLVVDHAERPRLN